MKKIFLYSLMLLSSVVFYSCNDKDAVVGENLDREFMPMFRNDNNTGKGSTDPYNCRTISPNDAYLCWYTVNDCAGYEIKWAVLAGSQGPVAWDRAEAAGTVQRVIIDNPQQFTYTVKHLEYGSTYSYAIRALHSLSVDENGIPNDPLNSKWYGYGDGRQWADYMNLDTEDRYETPTILAAQYLEKPDESDAAAYQRYKTSFRVYLDRSVDPYTAEEMDDFLSNSLEKPNGTRMKFFQTQTVGGKQVFKVDYIELSANASSLGATVPEIYCQDEMTLEDGTKIKCHRLTDEDWNRGYIDFEGLDENTVYNVNVYDEDIPYKADAAYNTIVKRTKGDPGQPITIWHKPQLTDTLTINEVETIVDISKWDACCLDDMFEQHMTSNKIAENQVYYLEGGKAYYISVSTQLYKGFTLATRPEDVEKGLRAKVYMNGIVTYNGGNEVMTCNFAFGRKKQSGESASVPLEIDSIKFQNIDFEAPLAHNMGHNNLDKNMLVTGNYFFNDIDANAMGYDLNYYEVSGCTFQGFRRGWMRTKTTHTKKFRHFYIYGNEFYNMGFYDNGGNGYGYLSLKGGAEKGANPYMNCEIINNTFYDSPCTYLCGNDAESLATWTPDQAYNITIKNNTFVNFNSLNKNGCLINPKGGKGVPRGSKFTVKNNLFINAYDEDDAGRAAAHGAAGINISEIKGVSSDKIYFYIENNWSTSDHLDAKTGEVFNNYAFSGTGTGCVGNLVKAGTAVLNDVTTTDTESEEYKNNIAKLKVQYEEGITSVVLMKDPNPKHHYGSGALSSAGPETFHTENLNGLYYNNTPQVTGSKIYTLKIGADKWRLGIGK